MMIKKLYYYFFYKVYKLIEYVSAPFGKWLINFKAGLVMIALQIWAVLSIGVYYSIITKTKLELSISMPIIYIPLITIIGFNYYSLDYLDQWKKYNKEFDELPKKKNIIGSWVVFGVAFLVIANLIFSFYCLDLKARRDHTGPYTKEYIEKKRIEDSIDVAKYKYK